MAEATRGTGGAFQKHERNHSGWKIWKVGTGERRRVAARRRLPGQAGSTRPHVVSVLREARALTWVLKHTPLTTNGSSHAAQHPQDRHAQPGAAGAPATGW